MMQWGVALNVHERLEDTIRFARILDEAAIDQLWIVDFPSPRFAPTVADKIASITSCRMGIGLLSPLIYDSDFILRFTETLVNRHGNRFDLLLGPGDRSALASIGFKEWAPKRIIEKCIETTALIKSELQERGISGKVWVGAQGPRMIKESTNGDGVLLNYTDPEMLAWALQQMPARDDHLKGAFVPTYLVRECVTRPPNEFLVAAAIVALGAPTKLTNALSLQEIDAGRAAYQSAGKLNASVLDVMTVGNLLRWGVYSTPKGTVDYVTSLERLGLDLIVFGPPISHHEASLKLLIEAFGK